MCVYSCSSWFSLFILLLACATINCRCVFVCCLFVFRMGISEQSGITFSQSQEHELANLCVHWQNTNFHFWASHGHINTNIKRQSWCEFITHVYSQRTHFHPPCILTFLCIYLLVVLDVLAGCVIHWNSSVKLWNTNCLRIFFVNFQFNRCIYTLIWVLKLSVVRPTESKEMRLLIYIIPAVSKT